MKKILVSVAILLSVTTTYARDTFDGCGLGWEVTDKKTVLATTTRGTTNGFVPPTFGMTTGTIGCEQFEGIAANEQEQMKYVAQNYETLRSQLAVGNGEYVDAAAQSFNCDSISFGQHMQQNYDNVVAPAQNGIELYKNLKEEARAICS